jgi:nucleoside-diphosphate-sugar epimerase
MNVLVTGGTGFLGGHVARALLARGDHPYLLGRDFGASAPLVADGAVPVRADLRDRASVVAACAGMDAVCHAGALSAPWGPRAEFHAVNVGGTEAVLEGCRRHGVRRLVHVSSPSVAFDGRDVRLQTEAAPYPRRFASVYSLTKKLAEDRVRAAADHVPSIILRPKAIFGPGDRALLPRLIAAARAGRLPQVGGGRNEVDLTYVSNVADSVMLALDQRVAPGGTYTITNGEHVALWPTIREVLRRLGVPARPRPVPLPVVQLAAGWMEARAAITGLEPTLTRYSAAILARTQTYDISAARRDLGYAPAVSVAEGLNRTLAAMGAS